MTAPHIIDPAGMLGEALSQAGQFSNNGGAPTNNRPHGLYTTVDSTVDKFGVRPQLMGHCAQFVRRRYLIPHE